MEENMNREQQFSLAMQLQREGKSREALEKMQKVAFSLLNSGEGEKSARALVNTGLLEVSIGRLIDAIHHFTLAKEQFEHIGDPLGAAGALGDIGSCYRDMEYYEEALEQYQVSLAIYETHKHFTGVANQRANIGYVYAMTGDLEKALLSFREARQKYRNLGLLEKAGEAEKNIKQIESLLAEESDAGN